MARRSKPRLRICAVTGTRADWGLLLPLLRAIKADPAFELKLIVTGQHLMRGGGESRRAIKKDGFAVDATVDMGLDGDDTPAAVTAALGRCIAGIGTALARLKPDLLFILGDRYEILGAATAATLARIPIVHNYGGDITEGAVDDSMRHAISKMSHVHFVSNAASGLRLSQMGEDPARVFVVGSSGVELIRSLRLMTRKAFFSAVGLDAGRKNIIVTFHPETLAADSVAGCREMLEALGRLGPEVGLLFCGSNADVGGRAIDRMVKGFIRVHPNAVFYESLGSLRYLSALKHCDAVVGNSSSGIYEAPTLQTPTVNIGDRQTGRLRAKSVIDVRADRNAIYKAVVRALKMDCGSVKNPYGDGQSSRKTVKAMKQVLARVGWDPSRLLKKTFAPWPS
jgi:UDP-hydrolysing UDP-N-acetyl-D-glucosamine 2-epimerase